MPVLLLDTDDGWTLRDTAINTACVRDRVVKPAGVATSGVRFFIAFAHGCRRVS